MKTPPVIRDKETLKMKLQLLEVNNSTVDFKWEMFLEKKNKNKYVSKMSLPILVKFLINFHNLPCKMSTFSSQLNACGEKMKLWF